MSPLSSTEADGGLFHPGERAEYVVADKATGARMSVMAQHPGVSLRDWFAGQALAGQLAFSPHDSFEKLHKPAEVAERMYAFADAMLAARRREPAP